MQLPQRKFERVAYRVLTPRLCLRAVEPRDAGTLQAAVTANFEHLAPWMPWAQELPTLDEQLRRTQQSRASFDLGLDFQYGLFDREHDQFLGCVGLHARCGPGGLEMGYWVDRNHEGRGLVAEACGALVCVALGIMGADWVEVRHVPENERSAVIPARLGFLRDGVLRGRCECGGGGRRDAVVWSMFQADFPGSPAAAAQFEAFDALGRPMAP